MKQKKPPFLMIGVVVILVGVVGVINALNRPIDPTKMPPQEAPKEAKTKQVSADEKAAAAEKLKGAIGAEKIKQMRRPAKDGMTPDGAPDMPSVQVVRPKAYKQEPNDSMTSGQWWTDDSYKKEKAQKLEKG